MTAVEFERFMDKNETVIRGNVFMEGKDSSATGEYATYFEKEEKVYLEGNPTLRKKWERHSCRKDNILSERR